MRGRMIIHTQKPNQQKRSVISTSFKERARNFLLEKLQYDECSILEFTMENIVFDEEYFTALCKALKQNRSVKKLVLKKCVYVSADLKTKLLELVAVTDNQEDLFSQRNFTLCKLIIDSEKVISPGLQLNNIISKLNLTNSQTSSAATTEDTKINTQKVYASYHTKLYQQKTNTGPANLPPANNTHAAAPMRASTPTIANEDDELKQTHAKLQRFFTLENKTATAYADLINNMLTVGIDNPIHTALYSLLHNEEWENERDGSALVEMRLKLIFAQIIQPQQQPERDFFVKLMRTLLSEYQSQHFPSSPIKQYLQVQKNRQFLEEHLVQFEKIDSPELELLKRKFELLQAKYTQLELENAQQREKIATLENAVKNPSEPTTNTRRSSPINIGAARNHLTFKPPQRKYFTKGNQSAPDKVAVSSQRSTHTK